MPKCTLTLKNETGTTVNTSDAAENGTGDDLIFVQTSPNDPAKKLVTPGQPGQTIVVHEVARGGIHVAVCKGSSIDVVQTETYICSANHNNQVLIQLRSDGSIKSTPENVSGDKFTANVKNERAEAMYCFFAGEGADEKYGPISNGGDQKSFELPNTGQIHAIFFVISGLFGHTRIPFEDAKQPTTVIAKYLSAGHPKVSHEPTI